MRFPRYGEFQGKGHGLAGRAHRGAFRVRASGCERRAFLGRAWSHPVVDFAQYGHRGLDNGAA